MAPIKDIIFLLLTGGLATTFAGISTSGTTSTRHCTTFTI
ncbi:hypothetical protein ANAEL_02864 [Anaerolineales bacterium]|nr:hypothetical protein ANAEL_02864 [Anaerolineales bacterium]